MVMIDRLHNFEPEKARRALDMLMIDRKNEFDELATAMNIPINSPGSEVTILRYCIDFDQIFRAWSEKNYPVDDWLSRTAMVLVRQIGRGKKSMIQITHLMNVAYDLYNEFNIIYKRIN